MTKTCSGCNIETDIENFAWRNKKKGTKQSHCKNCHNNYHKKHYKNNKKKYLVQKIESRTKIVTWLKQFKSNRPCVDCKVTYPHYVMDFDHVRGKKEYSVGGMVNNKSKDTILKEIAKCELVCSNCHRERTFRRREKGLESQ